MLIQLLDSSQRFHEEKQRETQQREQEEQRWSRKRKKEEKPKFRDKKGRRPGAETKGEEETRRSTQGMANKWWQSVDEVRPEGTFFRLVIIFAVAETALDSCVSGKFSRLHCPIFEITE